MRNKFIDLANSKIDSYASRTTSHYDITEDELTAIGRHLAVSGILENVDIRDMWRDKRGVLVICWETKNLMGDQYATYMYHDLIWYPWG